MAEKQSMLEKGKEYLTNLANAVTGVEGFVDQSGEVALAKLPAFFIVTMILYFLILFLSAYSAARLSYCYNIFTGSTSDVALLWSMVCFFFPGIYHVFYALALNPLCQIKGRSKNGVNNLGMMGGRK
jgi:hypothetical protein